MTIEHLDNMIDLACDGDDCGEYFGMPVLSQHQDVLLADAKQSGWRTYKKDGRWHHSCPACVREFANTQQGRQGRLV